VISKVHIRKSLQVNRLQKSIYGRLAVDGTLAPEAVRGVLNGRSRLREWSYTLEIRFYRIAKREVPLILDSAVFLFNGRNHCPTRCEALLVTGRTPVGDHSLMRVLGPTVLQALSEPHRVPRMLPAWGRP
jgi:hypothetical protein